ncbi:hypothetical protein [Chromobacterium violaceum]|nr:hypothetical protein [Chromobacterium violaceum]
MVRTPGYPIPLVGVTHGEALAKPRRPHRQHLALLSEREDD